MTRTLLIFSLIWVMGCSDGSKRNDEILVQGDSILIFKASTQGQMDSIQIHVNRFNGQLLRVIQYHLRDTVQVFSYNNKGDLFMWEGFGLMNGIQRGGRIYFDTTLRRTMEGPVEGMDRPFTTRKAVYFKDGKSIQFLLFMTEGQIDSIYRYDSLTHNLKGVSYPPSNHKRKSTEGESD